SDQPGARLAQHLVIRKPGSLPGEVRVDGKVGPVFQLVQDRALYGCRHQAQRVPVEVDDGLAAPRGHGELEAEGRQGIALVEAFGEVLAGVEAGRHARNRSRATDRNSSAVPESNCALVAASNSGIDSMSAPGTASPSGNG